LEAELVGAVDVVPLFLSERPGAMPRRWPTEGAAGAGGRQWRARARARRSEKPCTDRRVRGAEDWGRGLAWLDAARPGATRRARARPTARRRSFGGKNLDESDSVVWVWDRNGVYFSLFLCHN
jgi:hypothetical protein